MRQILLFGAGKSSTALIRYFIDNAIAQNWTLTVADADLAAINEKIGVTSVAKAVKLDIENAEKRKALIENADIVISLLPPHLHIIVAKDCISCQKNLLTASYMDDSIRLLEQEIENAGILFLYEMGLDPGIDHMSAKRIIDNIHQQGGKITSFYSHCGGLVAPQSDDNPWHYKISWNPRNIVMAGKSGAIFRLNGETQKLEYDTLFKEKRYVLIPGYEALCWYPNRDSLPYLSTYGLEETTTFIRTTLRHPDFIYGWKNMIELRLTDETKAYQTNGKTLMEFFKEHLDAQQFGAWLDKKLQDQFGSTQTLLSELVNLVKLEEEAVKKGITPVEEFMMVDDKGDLQKIDIDNLKITAAATLANRMHDANLLLKQLFFLGLDDEHTQINRGFCSAADVLQFALEKKLVLSPTDKDLVVMLHDITYEKDEESYTCTSAFTMEGEDAVQTAMSKTVGLPLAIAAKLLLNGKINLRGLHIPISKQIYEPVLAELENADIVFKEDTSRRL